jgi:hypothetical protein
MIQNIIAPSRMQLRQRNPGQLHSHFCHSLSCPVAKQPTEEAQATPVIEILKSLSNFQLIGLYFATTMSGSPS